MQCTRCGLDVPDDARFCMSCGLRIETPSTIRRPEDIDLDWVLKCMVSIGYDGEITETEDSKFIAARHEKHPNVFVELRSNLGLVVFSLFYSSVSGADLSNIEFLHAVNSFNVTSLRWTGWVADDSDFGANAEIALGTTMSEARFTQLLSNALDGFFGNVESSGLLPFLK